MFKFILPLVIAAGANAPYAFASDFAKNAKQAIEDTQQDKAVLLDVRESKEINATGRVKGALTFPTSKVGTAEWDDFVASLPKDKKIYTYCAKGGRAEKVSNELKKRGYQAVNAGGIDDLKKAGAVTQ